MKRITLPHWASQWSLALLVVALAGCKKDTTSPTPSNTALLTGPTWRLVDMRLTINSTEGVATFGTPETKFTADGKYTTTMPSSSPVTGTWAFANNETVLVQTPSGSGNIVLDPYQVYTLNATDLVVGYNFTQAQIQHALDNNNTTPTSTDRTILYLTLISSGFTFATPPPRSSTQFTSMSLRLNYKAK